MRWLLRPYREGHTYRVFLYLLLGLPLGVLEFTLVVTGIALGLGLMITIIGVPVLVAALMLAGGLAKMERNLASSLLDAGLPRVGDPRNGAGGIFLTRLRTLVTRKRTWRELAFLLMRLPMGALDFSFALALVALMISGPAQSIAIASGASTAVGDWNLHTVVESLYFWPISMLFVLVGPRLLLAWSGFSRRLATSLLGRVDQVEVKKAVIEVIGRMVEADGFAILDELALRLGRGPHLDATRIEAALLALESNGRINSHFKGDRAVYKLS